MFPMLAIRFIQLPGSTVLERASLMAEHKPEVQILPNLSSLAVERSPTNREMSLSSILTRIGKSCCQRVLIRPWLPESIQPNLVSSPPPTDLKIRNWQVKYQWPSWESFRAR